MKRRKKWIKKKNELDENKLANIDKQLVKPARGLIMYGPPGTSKSQIMSQLAKKLGIFMVGKLNRPYVGESERILVALCTRCH
jgi:ATP-dependent 26S proteasome regulatory subunit